MDHSRRELERLALQGDFQAQLKLMQIKARSGEIRFEVLELLAFLGYQPAKQLLIWPEESPHIVDLIPALSTSLEIDSTLRIDPVIQQSAISASILVLENSLEKLRQKAENNLGRPGWWNEAVQTGLATATNHVTRASRLAETFLHSDVTPDEAELRQLLQTIPATGISQPARFLISMCLHYGNTHFWNQFLRFFTSNLGVLRTLGGDVNQQMAQLSQEILDAWYPLILEYEQNRTRANPDSRIQSLERRLRSGDETARRPWLEWRLRSGESLEELRLEEAARVYEDADLELDHIPYRVVATGGWELRGDLYRLTLFGYEFDDADEAQDSEKFYFIVRFEPESVEIEEFYAYRP